jgi:Ulp1 family protease
LQVPQQVNQSECGYYLLHFAEAFLSAPDVYRGNILVTISHFHAFQGFQLTALAMQMNNKQSKKWGPAHEMRSKFRQFVEDEIANVHND